MTGTPLGDSETLDPGGTQLQAPTPRLQSLRAPSRQSPLVIILGPAMRPRLRLPLSLLPARVSLSLAGKGEGPRLFLSLLFLRNQLEMCTPKASSSLELTRQSPPTADSGSAPREPGPSAPEWHPWLPPYQKGRKEVVC